ncbi:hypothetical protein LP420_41655 [Massilia sp. B-10]|nr:hypothetical protein LP420_41655 [Massilia sp. B-10]
MRCSSARANSTGLAITRGFRDALRIAYQNRPRLFDRHIVLPELLYRDVAEIDERVGAHGDVITPLDEAATRAALQALYDRGLRSLAIIFMHGYRYSAHEAAAERIARAIGFTQVSVSHKVSPMMKLVRAAIPPSLTPTCRPFCAAMSTRWRGRCRT